MNANHQYRILLLIIVLLMSLAGYTATMDEKPVAGTRCPMVNLTLTDGLAGETVRSFMTDHNGLVWIATTGGVNIFDGKHLQTLRILNDKGHNTEIYDLCETHDGTV